MEETILLSQFTESTLNSDVPLNSMQEVDHDVENEEVQDKIDYELNALSTSICTLETCAVEYFAGYIIKRSTEKSRCDKCFKKFVDASREFQRDEQTLITFRAYIATENLDFGNLLIPSIEFSNVFKIINAVFDHFYPALRCETLILDKLFQIIFEVVHKEYPNWFIDNEYSAHRKDLVYIFMTVKIYKDTIWLHNQLKFSSHTRYNISRLRNLQNL